MPTFRYIPITAEAHTPPYKIHKYFARRPHNVFEQLIENFSDKNEFILDPFCGGGVTIYEGIRKDRKVVGCDLNPLSIFVVDNMIEKGCCDVNFDNAVKALAEFIGTLYGTSQELNYNGRKCNILWHELCFEVRCPKCGHTTPLSSQTKYRDGWYLCTNEFCENHNSAFKVSDVRRCGYRYLYASIAIDSNRKYVEISNEHLNTIKKHITFLKSELLKNNIKVPKDIIPIDWDRQFEDGLAKKGILYFQDFFTKRNLYILLLLKHKIDSLRDSLTGSQYRLLRIAFSNTLKETNVMSFTNDGWQGGKPTSWSKHAYWIPNQFCETNILEAFNKSIERVRKSVAYNDLHCYTVKRGCTFQDLQLDSNVFLFNGSVVNSGLTSNSVDAIITDPPYGSNVQYLELSHFWYPWNKDLYGVKPNFDEEAISNRKKGFKGAKDQYTYEVNLYKVFSKAYEVLKPGRYMTLTFNNKDMSSWLETGAKSLFPYRTFLEILLRLEGRKSINFFEFAFCIYPIVDSTIESIQAAVDDIKYARQKYPNWVDININNRETLLKEVNGYYTTTLSELDLWGSRPTTIKNQFGYFANHLGYLSDYIIVEGRGSNKAIKLKDGCETRLRKVLDETRDIEHHSKEQLLAKYTEAFLLLTLFIL